MKEHKNPKVLSEGLLWMVSAIEDFGISHLKLKVLELLLGLYIFRLCVLYYLSVAIFRYLKKCNLLFTGFN